MSRNGIEVVAGRHQLNLIKIWLFSGIALISLMVIIGGITRLTESGLSIVEWNVISGIIPPLNDAEWQIAFEKYQLFPEYQKLNYGMSLSQFKNIFFWEYLHRFLGRIIGITFIVPFLIFYFKGWLSKPLIKRLLLILILGGAQGVMGWIMVMSGLQDQPHVSHFRLAAHLSFSLILIGVLLWTILDLRIKPTQAGSRSNMTSPYICLALLCIQIIFGAFVAGLNAGFSYTNFPIMGQSFLPPLQAVENNSFWYNGAVLQFIHRWFAFVVLVSFLRLFLITKHNPLVRKFTLILATLAFTQVIVGIFTLMLRVPLLMGVIHQFLAVGILMMCITVLHKLRQGSAMGEI